ncbi:hypothetical protein ES708_12559 [subsurface metagenome]
MSIDEAIKMLSSDNPVLTPDEVSVFDEAIQLGIEALKRIHESRTPQSVNPHLTLPGETE